MAQRYVFGVLLYTVAFALAFVAPVASLALIAGLALLFVLPEPDERKYPDDRGNEDGESMPEDAQSTERPRKG